MEVSGNFLKLKPNYSGKRNRLVLSTEGPQHTPPIAEIICVKNVGEIVVCGFLMK